LLKENLFPELSPIALVIVTVLASVSVIENFVIRFADSTPVDIASLSKELTGTVLKDIGVKKTTLKRKQIQKVVTQLTERFADSDDELESEYSLYLLQSGLNDQEVEEEMRSLKALCEQFDINYARMLASRVAEFDLESARLLAR